VDKKRATVIEVGDHMHWYAIAEVDQGNARGSSSTDCGAFSFE